jgi:acyl-CoA thioester hydrolase
MSEITGARVVVTRMVAWGETDAAGHNHFSAAFRWLEETEHALYRCLGFDTAMIDRVPRVHVEADYRARLYYGDVIQCEVGVVSVGTSSCTFALRVSRGEEPAITGRYVVVHVAANDQGSAPWPEDMRAALTSPVAYTVESVARPAP